MTYARSDGHPGVRFAAAVMALGVVLAVAPSQIVAQSDTPPAVTAPASVSATPKVYYACYVPLIGTVYRVKEPGLPSACFFTKHVLFSWTDNGMPGPVGPQGPIGPQGAAGPAGATGVAGAVGPAGPAGLDGAPGAQGANGATGVAGPPGPAGANGNVGPTGAAGAQGPAGTTGVAGPAGPAGLTGSNGPAGPTGADGAIGPAGPAGATGVAGATGSQGIQGIPGIQGVPGAQGPAGGMQGHEVIEVAFNFDIQPQTGGFFFAICPAGKKPIGGGHSSNGTSAHVSISRPGRSFIGAGPVNSWEVWFTNTGQSAIPANSVRAYAVCVIG